ncbi:unnamed protein product, partial [Gadus morhua 'NCC']
MGGVGHTVILPCLSSLEGSCSDIRWFHGTKSGTTLIASISRREDTNTGRFNIVSNCSLHINNITEVDVGIYSCSKDIGDLQYLSLITEDHQMYCPAECHHSAWQPLQLPGFGQPPGPEQ